MTLLAGAQAPEFTLKDQNNSEISLADFAGRKNVLLVFYPAAFTRICQGELNAIRDHLGDFRNESTEVLAVSVDSVFSHKVWAQEQGFDFPLLADFWPHGAVAQAYGAFNDVKGVAERASFVIDRAGIIRYAEINHPGEARDSANWRQALSALAD